MPVLVFNSSKFSENIYNYENIFKLSEILFIYQKGWRVASNIETKHLTVFSITR